MISKISHAHQLKNQEKITNYLKKTINFIWLAASPITFGICAIIKNFVPWFYSSEYLAIINLVYIMSPIIIIISLNNLIGVQFLVSTKNQNKYILAVIIGAITNFILNLILIPTLSSLGATIASVIAELIILIIELHYFKKIIPNINILKDSPKYTLYGLIMFIITYQCGNLFKPTIHNTIFQILIGITIYITLLIITKDKFIFNYLNKLKNTRKKSRL
jgi:O-antigen/teichoic acid export membrane protein